MPCRRVILIAAILAAGGLPAAASEQPIKVSAADRAACMPDARRLCSHALPNVRNVVICFLGQKSKLSNGCRAVLASYGL
jgi:hypothetical protein